MSRLYKFLEMALLVWRQPSLSRRNELAWKNEQMIRKVTAYNGVSDRIASLQLFYELAPQCQNRPKSQRIMKAYPRFVTNLFRDLANAIQESVLESMRSASSAHSSSTE